MDAFVSTRLVVVRFYRVKVVGSAPRNSRPAVSEGRCQAESNGPSTRVERDAHSGHHSTRPLRGRLKQALRLAENLEARSGHHSTRPPEGPCHERGPEGAG